MSPDLANPFIVKLREATPSSRQAVKFMTAVVIGLALLVGSSLTFVLTTIGLIVTTPVLVLFSPVLVPAAIVVLLITVGFFFSGGCGLAVVTALSWIYNYMTGKQPLGSEKLEQAREVIAEKAKHMGERAKEYGQYVQHKAHEATTR